MNNESGESTLVATLGEDGLVLIWDLKEYDLQSRGETSPYYISKPVLKVEVNKMDCKKLILFLFFHKIQLGFFISNLLFLFYIFSPGKNLRDRFAVENTG